MKKFEYKPLIAIMLYVHNSFYFIYVFYVNVHFGNKSKPLQTQVSPPLWSSMCKRVPYITSPAYYYKLQKSIYLFFWYVACKMVFCSI